MKMWTEVKDKELPVEYKDFLLYDNEIHKKRIGMLSGDRWLFDDGTEVLVREKAVTHFSELLADPEGKHTPPRLSLI